MDSARHVRRPRSRLRRTSIEGLRAGFRFILADPVLRLITLAWIVLLFLLGPVLVAELPLARSFGAGSVGYGILVACWGGGAIVGSLLGRRLAVSHERMTMIGGAPSSAPASRWWRSRRCLGSRWPGWRPPAWPRDPSRCRAGHPPAANPDAVRSRSTAAIEAASLGAFALSFPAAGFMINLIGVRGVYLLAGAGCAVSALILIPAMRGLTAFPGQRRRCPIASKKNSLVNSPIRAAVPPGRSRRARAVRQPWSTPALSPSMTIC